MIRIAPLLVLASMTAVPEATAATPALREQLAAGQLVKVEGRSRDGVFSAEQVTLRDVVDTVKVEGAIEAVSDGGRRLRLLDFPIEVDASTRLYRGSEIASSRAMLVRGAWIEAKGVWRRGVLKATRIRVKAAPEPTEEIEAVIQEVDTEAATLLLLERRVVVQPDAVVVDERTGRLPQKADRLRRDDDDAKGREPIAFGNVVVGGRIEGGFLDAENFDIGAGDAERTVLSRLQLLASSQITDTIEAYTKVTLTRNMAAGGAATGDARLSEGYVTMRQVAGSPVDIQIGRQRFRDSREWFFDDYLDAARVHVTLPRLKFEAAVSRGVFSGDQATRRRRDQLQFIGAASTRLAGVQLRAYTLARRDITRNERPIWIGGTVDGRAGRQWSYWGEASTRRGTSATARFAGWALDGGVKHAWRGRWSPTLTLAHAFGSGDPSRGDGVDTRFRQTDLEDNQAYYGGLRRIASYGELFDPELSNLNVFTAAFGIRPHRGASVDAIYHRFVQAVAARSLPSSNLEGSLNGTRRVLGDELDFVFTLRATRGVDLDLATGVFTPGPAFIGSRKAAFFWRPQLRVYF